MDLIYFSQHTDLAMDEHEKTTPEVKDSTKQDKSQVMTEIFYGPVAAVNSRDLSLLDKYVAEKCIIHNSKKELQGLSGLKKICEVLLIAFPDLHITIVKDSEIIQGEMISHHTVFSGTNTGTYKGMPPTGKHAIWNVVRTAKIEEGKITELWIDSDRLSMLMQIDAVHMGD
jgi:predicted ester cyclase